MSRIDPAHRDRWAAQASRTHGPATRADRAARRAASLSTHARPVEDQPKARSLRPLHLTGLVAGYLALLASIAAVIVQVETPGTGLLVLFAGVAALALLNPLMLAAALRDCSPRLRTRADGPAPLRPGEDATA